MNAKTPDSASFDEMICDTCTLKNDFLNLYSGYCITSSNDRSSANTTLDTTINVTDLDVSTMSNSVNEASPSKDSTTTATGQNAQALDADINECIQNIIDITRNNAEVDAEPISSSSSSAAAVAEADLPSRKRSQSDANENCATNKRAKLNDNDPASQNDPNVCRRPTVALHTFTGASFWLYEWRSKLCRCTECVRMYTKNGVAFLIDDDDTVKAYQEKGKAKSQANQADGTGTNGLGAASDVATQLATMTAPTAMASGSMHFAGGDEDHTSKVEAILAYNKLKEKLTEFFSSFVENEKVITTKDVNEFFQNAKKDKNK